MRAEQEIVKKRGRDKSDERRKLKSDLESLDTQEGQQLNFMRKQFPELATAWDWVQEHQGEFEKEVFGPPMLCCSVKDDRYSNQVQALLQSDDFLCFTAQTKNDYRKLTDQLYREMSLSAVIRTCLQPLSAFRPPASIEEAQSLGLDGFALHYLEGPEPVLAMLCAEKRLHQSGVSLKDLNDDEYEKLVHHGRINQWAAGKQQYMVRRRKEYGPNAMTTVTKRIQPGRFWTSQPVDSQEKVELNRRLLETAEEMEILKVEFADSKEKVGTFEGQKAELQAKIVRQMTFLNIQPEYTNNTIGTTEDGEECAAKRAHKVAGHTTENRLVSRGGPSQHRSSLC